MIVAPRRQAATLSASLIGHLVSSTSDYPPLQCRCRSRARASLRNRHQALPSWDSKTRRNNLCRGLAVLQTAGPSRLANSPHPSSREGHPSTARWISDFLLGMITHRFAGAAVAQVLGGLCYLTD